MIGAALGYPSSCHARELSIERKKIIAAFARRSRSRAGSRQRRRDPPLPHDYDRLATATSNRINTTTSELARPLPHDRTGDLGADQAASRISSRLGTSGTIMGTGRFLKSKRRACR